MSAAHPRKEDAVPGGWSWPDDLSPNTPNVHANPPSSAQRTSTSTSSSVPERERERQSERGNTSHGPPPKTYRPRTCRICLETVQPTYHPPSEDLPSFLAGRPNVTYESENGRLIRPCHCKGSSRYVHEECLELWRHADPNYSRRNYWQCPTCGFKYRLQRMSWGRWISSVPSQLLLTLLIFMATIFLLGFIADPIINMYYEPMTTLSDPKNLAWRESIVLDEKPSWKEHFLKGFASLGLMGFVKALMASPIRFFQWRGVSGRASTSRDRMEQISWFVVVMGALMFLGAVYKAVRAWSKRVLKGAAERVMDVGGNDDEDDYQD